MWDVSSLVILTTLVVSFFLSEMHIALSVVQRKQI